MLNFTIEFSMLFLGFIGLFFSSIIIVIQIWKGTRYMYFILLFLSTMSGSLMILFWSLSILFLNSFLIEISGCLFVILGFFTILVSDTISHESADPIKLIIYSLLSMVAIFEYFQPQNFFITTLKNGNFTIGSTPIVFISEMPFLFFYNLIYIFTIGKMVFHAPKSIIFYAKLYFWGYMITSFGAIFALTLNEIIFILPGLQALCTACGILMLTITVSKHPKLIFILPFKIIRITVMDTKTGLAIFNYNWIKTNNSDDERLYGGMLQGVNLLIQESIKQGNIQEIRTEKAVIIAHRSNKYSIACFLVAIKVSKTLIDGLRNFAERFYQQYAPFFSSTFNITQFQTATELIKEIFPFVPEYN